MGWMHDTLVYLSKEPVHRQYHHHQMTFATVYAWTENFVLPISHDEVVHGKHSLVAKAPGDWWQQRATLRTLLAFMWSFPASSCCSWDPSSPTGRSGARSAGLNWACSTTRPTPG
jgi:1,4-alpha-glucan branching enzyme